MAFSISRLQLRRIASPRISSPKPSLEAHCKTLPRCSVNEQVNLSCTPKVQQQLNKSPTSAASSIKERWLQESPSATSSGQRKEMRILSKSFRSVLFPEGTLAVSEPLLLFEKKDDFETCVVPSVDSPNRSEILRDGLNARKSWVKLGQGSFGTVVHAQYKGDCIAAKLIPLKHGKSSLASLRNEANALLLSHTNIVKVLQVFTSEGQHGMVLMERSTGTDLQTLIHDPTFNMTWLMRHKCAIDIASGIHHCHQHQVLHLDIKPQNILYAKQTHKAQLCDFGSSCVLENQSSIINVPSHQGTVIYTDPDILQSGCASKKSDVYSYGITLWQLLTREIPYSTYKLHLHTIIYKVVSEELRPRDVLTTGQHNTDYKALYKLCWHQRSEERPSMEQVIQTLDNIANSNTFQV